MNPLDYIYDPITPFALLGLIATLVTLWRIARHDAKSWEDSCESWKSSSREWEGNWESINEENAKLRREIVELAKGRPEAPANP